MLMVLDLDILVVLVRLVVVLLHITTLGFPTSTVVSRLRGLLYSNVRGEQACAWRTGVATDRECTLGPITSNM